jgi:hypothetical protein
MEYLGTVVDAKYIKSVLVQFDGRPNVTLVPARHLEYVQTVTATKWECVPSFNSIGQEEEIPADIHNCAPYVGISHVENTCVYCSRRMTNSEVQLYMKDKGL